MKQLIAGLFLLGALLTGAADTDDFERMRRNFSAASVTNAESRIYRAAEAENQVKAVLDRLQSDGSLAGVDYNNFSQIREHLAALGTLALAWSDPAGPCYHREELKKAFFRLSDFWLARNPGRGVSWYFNEIGIPTEIARGILPFYDAMKSERPELIAGWAKQMASCERSIDRHLGANLVDVSYAALSIGALTGDRPLIEKTLKRLDQKSFQYAYGGTEGLHVDNSYSSHNYDGGRQAYDGGYGVSYLVGGSRILQLVKGTSFQPAPESVNRFTGYLLDGFRWKCYRGHIDPQVSGRRVYLSGRYPAPTMTVGIIAEAVPVRQAEAKEFAASLGGKAPEVAGNRMFYWTDMMVHRNQDFYTSVRMNSTRTLRSEGHGQWFSADGAYVVLVRGDEYDGVFAAGDLFRIPGATGTYLAQSEYQVPTAKYAELEKTCDAIKNDAQGRLAAIRDFKKKYSAFVSPDASKQEDLCIKIEDFGSEFGSSRTAGGVSDGEAGLCAMEFARNQARAFKAYFFPGDYFVALGAGIAGSDEKRPVRTTVNQCRANGPATADGKVVAKLDGETVQYVHHDNVGAVFFGDNKVSLARETLTNELFRLKEWPWANYEFKLDRGTRSSDVFALWLEHGVKPQGVTYAYAVLPGVDAARTAAFAAKPPCRVLANTPDLQAVEAENYLGAVFYRAGKVKGGAQTLEVECSSPVAVLIRRDADGKRRIYAADLQLRSGGKVRGVYTGPDGKKEEFTLKLPKDDFAGSTVSRTF